MPKFLALKKGFDGTKIVNEGETFDAPVWCGDWMQPIDEVSKENPEPNEPAKAPVKRSKKAVS